MRRIITVLLCAVMLLGLVACGSEGGTDSDDPQDEAPDDAEIPGDQADRDTAEDDKDAGDTDTDADAETDADQQGGQDQSEDPGDVGPGQLLGLYR